MTTAEGWSNHAEMYAKDAKEFTQFFADRMVELVAKREQGRQRAARLEMLDVACGPGIAGVELAARFPRARVVACDWAEGMVAIARRRGGERGLANLEAQVADATALPFADGSFDVVVSNFGLFLIPERAKAYAEAARVLRAGGVLLSSIWDMPADLPEPQYHELMMRAMRMAKGGPKDGAVPRLPFFLEPAQIEEEARAIGGFAEVRVLAARASGVMTPRDVHQRLTHNPVLKGMAGGMSEAEFLAFKEKFLLHMTECFGARSPDDVLLAHTAASLLVATKQ